MKKAVLSFSAFCLVFVLSLGLIYTLANPAMRLPSTQDIAWNGHVENAQGTYNGTIINELFSGHGIFNFLSGEVYTGEWSNSFMSGNGTIIFPQVGTYTGAMLESKRAGMGTFTWNSGAKYIGNWENDAMSGSGSYYFENGCVFEGIFASNKPIEGTLLYKAPENAELADMDIQELTYKFSNAGNIITFRTKGDLIYSGDLSGLDAKGNAEITYPSGNTYEGSVSKGKRDGIGKYFWKDEKGNVLSYYDGAWTDDHMNGQGKYFYTCGQYPYLQGSFVNDCPEGNLTYYRAAGNTFETTWSDGVCTTVKET